MSIFDQIARGIAPIGQDLPQIAGLIQQRNRFDELRDFQREQFEFQKGRVAKEDIRQERVAATEAERKHSEQTFLIAEFALRSGDPRGSLEELPEVTQALDSKNIPWREWSQEQAAQYFQRVRMVHGPRAGISPERADNSRPSSVEEFEFFNTLPQEQQRKFLEVKRSPASPQLVMIGGVPTLASRTDPGAVTALSTPEAERSAAAAQAAAIEGAKTSVQTRASTDTKSAEQQAALQLYEAARIGLLKGLERSETGPVVGRIPAFTSAQQTAAGGVAAMAPVLKQLFRVSGEGVFTDRDQALLIAMVPDRTDTPEARKNKIENIDAIVKAKLRIQGTQAVQPAQPSAQEFDYVPGQGLVPRGQ